MHTVQCTCTNFLSSLTFKSVTSVGCVVNWVSAAGSRRDIRSTTLPAGAIFWKWWIGNDNNDRTFKTVVSCWEPLEISGNAYKYL